MTALSRTALLPYSAAEMFALVNDVARYREFLPYCVASEVLQADAEQMTARLGFARLGISQEMVTQNRWETDRRIELALVSGPFDRLSGLWEFQPLQAMACKIHFSLDFQVQQSLLQMAAQSALSQSVSQTVDAFQRRAVQVYGKR